MSVAEVHQGLLRISKIMMGDVAGPGLSCTFGELCADKDVLDTSSFIKFDRFFRDPKQDWGKVKSALKFMGLSHERSNVLYRLTSPAAQDKFHPLSLAMYYLYKATPHAVESFLSRYNASYVQSLADALCELVNNDGMSHNLGYVQRIREDGLKNRLMCAYVCAAVKYAIGYKNPPKC